MTRLSVSAQSLPAPSSPDGAWLALSNRAGLFSSMRGFSEHPTVVATSLPVPLANSPLPSMTEFPVFRSRLHNGEDNNPQGLSPSPFTSESGCCRNPAALRTLADVASSSPSMSGHARQKTSGGGASGANDKNERSLMTGTTPTCDGKPPSGNGTDADGAGCSPISAHSTQSGALPKGGISSEVSMKKIFGVSQQPNQQATSFISPEIYQRDCGGVALVPEPALLPESEISLCRTFRDALGLCIQRARVRRTQNDLAGFAGIHPTQFSKILHGAKGQTWSLDPERIEALEQACGNRAMTQWLAARAGLRVVQETPEQRRIRELEEQIATMKREAA